MTNAYPARRTRIRRLIQNLGAAALGMLTTSPAWATDAMRFPDNGTQQLSRGGAWVARATNPLATLYNPAALSTQQSGALLDLNLSFYKVCFTREGQGSTVSGPNVKYPADVCNANTGTPSPLPSGAVAIRVSDRLGLGYSISPPSLYGHLRFPDTVSVTNSSGFPQDIAAPQRYQIMELGGILLNQTFSAGFSITPRLHVGAGFIWGLGTLQVTSATMSLPSGNPPPGGQFQDNPGGDIWAHVVVRDLFIPGAVFGVLYSPVDLLDLGLNVTAQEAFDAHGTLTAKANYWSSDNPPVTDSNKIQPGMAHFRLENPFDVRLGARFHLPRSARAAAARQVRDPLVDDVFDVEADLTYTRNSVYKAVELRFPNRPDIPINGVGGGVVPKNADTALNLKGDTLGVRLGGDYVVLPGKLAVRAGAWYEPGVQRAQDLNVTVVASRRIGLAGGVQVRLGNFDLEAGYMHVFFASLDNGGNGRLRALSGDQTARPVHFRSPYTVNGGRLNASANILSLGTTMHF